MIGRCATPGWPAKLGRVATIALPLELAACSQAMSVGAPCYRMSPTFDNELGLLEGVEDLAVEKFVPELRVEALAISVLPRTTRHDVGGPGSDRCDPFAHIRHLKTSQWERGRHQGRAARLKIVLNAARLRLIKCLPDAPSKRTLLNTVGTSHLCHERK